MENYSAESLYIVKPSIALKSNTTQMEEYFQSGETFFFNRSILEFEKENIDIAVLLEKGYKSIFSDRIYYEDSDDEIVEGKYYVGILPNDCSLIKEYEDNSWETVINKYILNLKSYYSYEELKKILQEIKDNHISGYVGTKMSHQYQKKI